MKKYPWEKRSMMEICKAHRANRRKLWQDLEETLNLAQHIIEDNGLSPDAGEDIERLKAKLLKQMKHDVFNY